eukprot:7513360-Pyramimonas_sp.AAC.1
MQQEAARKIFKEKVAAIELPCWQSDMDAQLQAANRQVLDAAKLAFAKPAVRPRKEYIQGP